MTKTIRIQVKNSLDKKENEVRISFKISRTFFPIEPSLDNFFVDASSIVDITKIVKKKRINTKGEKKVQKEENYITLFEDEI